MNGQQAKDEDMAADLVRLDLSRFTRADIDKIEQLGSKLRLMHRWFRYERLVDQGVHAIEIYSGDRGPRRYIGYRIVRREDGEYELYGRRDTALLARSRSIDAVLHGIPDDFFYNAN
jgi:hypothetical protein